MANAISGRVVVNGYTWLRIIEWYMVGLQASLPGILFGSFFDIGVAAGLDSSILNVAKIIRMEQC